MLMLAILSEDLDTFNTRLNIIINIPLEEFSERIEEVKKNRMKILEDAKQKMLKDIAKRHKKSSITEKELTKDEQTFLNKGIENWASIEISQLDEDERIMLDIPIFFENIRLLQYAYLYEDLLPKDLLQKKLLLADLPNSIATIIIPEKLERLGGIAQLTLSPGGCYSKEELVKYFTYLNKIFYECDYPISLICQSADHNVTIGYDHQTSTWIAGDPNQLPPSNMSDEDIANYIHKAYFESENTIFSAKISVAKPYENELQSIIKNLQSSEEWNELQEINEYKAKAIDAHGASLLTV
jgi:hypothetical protein